MNNEPVAWMNEHGEISQEEHWAYPTPLYTHPAKTLNNQKMIDVLMELAKYRLLTADEVEELAILRKASEK
jgi:hypothetical protein